MKNIRQRFGIVFLSSVGLIAVMMIAAVTAVAGDEYPSSPVNLVVAFRSGGTTDTLARVLAKPLSDELGQPVVVSNKPGAAGTLAFVSMKKEKPDGYFLTAGVSFTLALIPVTKKKPGYKFEDFQPIACLARAPMVMVSTPNKPWKNWEELIAYAKKNPGLSCATGPVDKLFLRYIAKKEGIQWNLVPFKGGGEMVSLLLGGHVDFAFSGGIHTSYVKSNEMIVLLSLSKESYKMEGHPEVPSLLDLGYDMYAENLLIVQGPKGMPEPVVAKLSNAFMKVCNDPSVKDIMQNKLNFEPVFLGPKEAGEALESQYQSFKKLVGNLK